MGSLQSPAHHMSTTCRPAPLFGCCYRRVRKLLQYDRLGGGRRTWGGRRGGWFRRRGRCCSSIGGGAAFRKHCLQPVYSCLLALGCTGRLSSKTTRLGAAPAKAARAVARRSVIIILNLSTRASGEPSAVEMAGEPSGGGDVVESVFFSCETSSYACL